jgi:hypothetical protein
MTATPFETLSRKLIAPKTKAPLDCKNKEAAKKKIMINWEFASI